MKEIQKENYKILKDEESSIAEFATYLSKNQEAIRGENIVIDLLDQQPDEKDLLAFLEISDLHRKQKKSFVIAAKGFSIDAIPEELFVVPTLREAEDVIQMEELERELGM